YQALSRSWLYGLLWKPILGAITSEEAPRSFSTDFGTEPLATAREARDADPCESAGIGCVVREHLHALVIHHHIPSTRSVGDPDRIRRHPGSGIAEVVEVLNPYPQLGWMTGNKAVSRWTGRNVVARTPSDVGSRSTAWAGAHAERTVAATPARCENAEGREYRD